MSVIYIKNSRGPFIDACGSPVLIFRQGDLSLSNLKKDIEVNKKMDDNYPLLVCRPFCIKELVWLVLTFP